MTQIQITEQDEEVAGSKAIERLKMQLDTPPTPAVLNQIIALLNTPTPPVRKRRKDAGKSREVKS